MADINTLITLTPIVGQNGGDYAPVVMSLVDHSEFGPSGSNGGWQVVDRPKSAAATQWFDRSPFQLKFVAYLDKSITSINPVAPILSETSGLKRANAISTPPAPNVPPVDASTPQIDDGTLGESIEDYCSQLESWLSPVGGTYQPPIIKLDAKPLPGKSVQYWVLYGLDFGEAIRNTVDGLRVQQKVSITLYEYLPPLSSGWDIYGITDHVSLFNSYLTNTVDTSYIKPKISSKQYKVIAGDTLSKIATKNKTTAAKIISLNTGMSANQGANFSKVYLGRTIRIPA